MDMNPDDNVSTLPIKTTREERAKLLELLRGVELRLLGRARRSRIGSDTEQESYADGLAVRMAIDALAALSPEPGKTPEGRETVDFEALERQMREAVMRSWDDWRQGLADGAFTHADGMRFKLRVEAAIGVVVGQFQHAALSPQAGAPEAK